VIEAVLWDFGGVILSSPFDAFNQFERDNELPIDFIRTVNSTDLHANAWARLERSEISAAEFDLLFADEAHTLGHRVNGSDVLGLLSGSVREEMVDALDRVIAAGYKTACLTNNISAADADEARATAIADVLARFDAVIESSKVGVRKPDPRFYEMACELLDVKPEMCVFLDDLGINLKPAKAMGMTTIKVLNAAQALADLEAVVGFPLND
jgi:putative hydrolase of the HAD superfamily